MQSPPLRRGGPAQGAEAFTFETKLENEETTLDAIIASMARGALPAGTWERLHAAAQRDGRMSELAFAFERASQGKRVKSLAPTLAAEFFFQAAGFFGDAFGDEVGALTYLERALALVPAHGPSFAKIEQVLLRAELPKRLAEVYTTTAQHRPRSEQPALLRRAADLLSQAGGADDKVIDLLQHVLRIEPGDEQTRAQLEELCVRANRLRDVVRLNEQALAAEPPPDEERRRKLLARIIELYADNLHEPERAMPHIEQLLAIDPADEQGRKVAQKLVVVKGLAGRAAAVLANACEATGTPQDVAGYLTIELESTRGPKRASLLARLGKLKQERLGDPAGAFDALEQALSIDASDDELRAAYVGLAEKLGRHAEAGKTLGRVLATVKSPTVKARAAAQLGEMLVRSGDTKRAKLALAGVLASADAPADAVLAAAYPLAEIHKAEHDPRSLGDVLERIALLEPDPGRRQAVDERLAELATGQGDSARAVAAYERLLTTSSRARALAALVPLYEAGKDPEKQARLLEEQAKDTTDPGEARDRMMRAVEVRAKASNDPAAAITSCRAIIDRFGPAGDVLALMVPLLESQRKWPELGRALAAEAALTTGAEHTQIVVRLGILRMQRLGDSQGAIEAFGEALALDAGDRTARMMLEKLTVVGDHRLAAARVLEPVYRRQGASASLLKVLELRGTLSADVDDRLTAMREAAGLADGAEAGRSTEVLGRALADAVANDRAIGEWLERLDVAAGPGTDAKRRAAILATAIGDRDVTSADLSALAKRAAEAHAATGLAQEAIALYRRALAFEPHSTDLLSRIDDLLRDQGSAEERVALYRAALARAGEAKKRELLHRIGAIERHDLRNLDAAIATYRTALERDGDDADAHAALAELYSEAGRWADSCALLESRLERIQGEAARTTRAALAAIAAAHGDQARARTHCAALLADPDLAPDHLEAVAGAADALGDADLQCTVLQRRAEKAHDPRDQIALLDRLGELEEQRGELDAAAAAWKRAASLAEATGEDEVARRLYWRARKVAPEDRDVTARLAALCERAEIWKELPPLYVSIAAQSTDDAERVELWLRAARVLSDRLGDTAAAAQRARSAFELDPTRADVLSAFEELSVASGAGQDFEQAIDELIERVESTGGLEREVRVRLSLSRARVSAADPLRADDAVRVYRAILEDRGAERSQVVAALTAFEALIAGIPDSTRRRADRRWLLEWRAEHAAEEERVGRLLDWAREEEAIFADRPRAMSLYRRALEIDADSDQALSGMTRLALATGDTDEALAAMRTRRDRTDGPTRIGLEREIAQVLLSRTTRWPEALASVRAVLAEMPNDAEARALAGQLLGHRATRADTIRMLEQACDATDDVSARTQIVTRLLDTPADTDDAGARRAWFERLCDLQREHEGPQIAMATAVRAAREMPDVAALWDRAERLARDVSHPQDMAALYEEVLARALTADQARTIGERAVQFYEEWFEDGTQVVRTLERVLELDPTAEWAFDRLKLVLDAAERWDDLFALYDRALDSATGRKRTTLLEDAAQTAKDFADRPDRAIQYLEQLHELKPNDAKLTNALERLYERQGRHRELVALLGARLPILPPDEARRTRTRVASLWLDELGDTQAALEVIEPVLQSADESASDAAMEVWALLERILSAAPPTPEPRRSTGPPAGASERPPRSRRTRKSEPPSSSPGSVRQRAAAWLRDHYARSGRGADLVRMLLVELEAVKTPGERVRRHLQIAESYEKLGDPASAFEQVGLATVLDPNDDGKRAKLAQLAEQTGRLERFADLLAAAAEASEGALRVALTMQAGAVRADRIADAAGAIVLFSSVLATPVLRDEDMLAAGQRLDPLLEAAGREEDRLDVLERLAHVEPDGESQRRAMGRAARLAAQLGQDPRAIALWERRIVSRDQDTEALDALVDLLERTGNVERLAQVLGMRARAATSADGSRADRARVAKLLGDALKRPEEAISAWREIERDFGEADDAALALATLLRMTQRWKDLATLLEHRAERTSEEVTRAELLRQLGDVHREQLGAPSAAVETYGRALSADPRNKGARSGLLALADHDGLGALSTGVLLGALRACDDWRSVLELTPRRLLAAQSDAERVAVLLEAAQASEQRAGNVEAAFEAVQCAFVIAPDDDHIERDAARLAEAANAFDRLVDSYREAVDGGARGNVALVSRLRANAGAILETRLDDARGALAMYLLVAQDASQVGSACAAVRVAAKLGEWSVGAQVVVDIARAGAAAPPELLDAYAAAADRAGNWDEPTRALAHATATGGLAGAGARDVEARLADWHRERRNDPDAAQAALERALAHDGSDTRLLERLVELQRRSGGPALVESLLRLSKATGEDLALLREAAEVARSSAGDLPSTQSILTNLLALARARWNGEPSAEARGYTEWAIETLADLHEKGGNALAVVDVLMQGDALAFPLETRREMRRRAAQVAHLQLGDDERAIALYLSLVDDDPHDERAAEMLATLYATHARTRELLSLRERQIAAATELSVRVALRLGVARLLVALGESSRAPEVLRESLKDEPCHEETVTVLAGVLDADGRTGELRDLLVDQAQRADAAADVTRATDLWWRAAVLAEERLHDDAAAEACHARVAALQPRPASLDALGRLATARKDHGAAARWLERLLEVVNIDQRIAATLRLADALAFAGDPVRAAERLAGELAQSPQAEPLRERLATLYRAQGDWERLAILMTDAAAHAPDKATRMIRLLEAARLLSERCGDSRRAIPLLEQATDLLPDDQSARLALADALARSGRFDDARSILKQMVDSFGGRRPKERAPVHYQIARLELAMGNRARALVELDTAARVDPQNPDILRTLAELARDDGQLERAEKSYRALLVALRRRDEIGESQSVARSEVLLELSAIADRQGEGERAKEILESALEAAAKSDFEHERMEGALRTRGDYETLARMLDAKVARTSDAEAAAHALGQLAEVLADRLGRRDQALAARLRALALDARSETAHEAALTLARTVNGATRYTDCTAALADRAVEQGDAKLACSLLVRLGEVAEQDLRNDGLAASFYERAVDLGLRSAAVLRALDRVLHRLGDSEKQARVLSMRVDVEALEGGPQNASDALYRLAGLRLSSRRTFDEGVEWMRKAMDLDPQLDRAEETLRSAVALDPNHTDLLDLYERIGRQPGRERALVDALRVRFELAGSDPNTVREAVDVAVRIGDRPLAESVFARVVEREQSTGENVALLAWALDGLANLRRDAADLPKAIELKRAAAQIADPETARKLMFEVGRIAADELGDCDIAAEAYENLHRADPADRDAWELLLGVYRRQGDARKLSELLASVVDYVDDAGLRARMRLERVRAMQDLGMTDGDAAPLLREIVDEDASQVEAAFMLAAILERAGDGPRLIELLAKQIDSAKDRSDSASIASLSTRLGALLEPSDRMQARDVYYTALEWEANSPDLLDALIRLLEGEENAAERADVLERRLAIERGPAAEAIALALCATRTQLGDEAGTERALEVGYATYPASAALRDRLEAAFRRRSDWRKLADLCVTDAGTRTNAAERVARLQEAAAIWRTQLGDPRRAAAALRLARDAAPTSSGEPSSTEDALLRDHVELLLEAGDADAALSELSAAIERLTAQDARRAELLAARASLRSSIGDESGTLEDLEAAFAIDKAEYAKSLAVRLERAYADAAAAGDAVGARAFRLRLAQVLPSAGDPDGARKMLTDLLKQDPKDPRALRTLASLESALDRWDAASVALKRLVGLEGSESTADTALRLADACERAGRLGDARGALERARVVAPQDRAVRERLERVYDQTGAWHELSGLVLEDARTTGDVAHRFQLLVRAGSLLLERAGDPTAAIEGLEEAHALRPLDLGCLAMLADAYTLSGRAQDAVALLESAIAPHKGRRARELAPIHYRLARAARYFGNTPEEMRCLVQAVDSDTQNGEVCAAVALRAMEMDQFELANRALRAITLLKNPTHMSKALAYQYMGEIARKQGDAKRALMLLHRAVAEDPTLEGARALVDAIERGV